MRCRFLLMLVLFVGMLDARDSYHQNNNQRLNAAIESEMSTSLPVAMPKMSLRQPRQQSRSRRSPKSYHHGKSKKVSFLKQPCFKNFIEQIYNNRRYADVLSQDSDHFEAMFKLSDELSLPAKDVHELIRLYYNKLKSCEIIDPIVFERLSQVVPYYTRRFFAATRKALCTAIPYPLLFFQLLHPTQEHSHLQSNRAQRQPLLLEPFQVHQ